MRVFSTPWLVRQLIPDVIWRMPTRSKTIYLTFDDGPIPAVTEFVLRELNKYQGRATFFCVGDNVRKYRGLARQVILAGHTLANHTCHHVKGWNTPAATYLTDINRCQEELALTGLPKKNNLFRPPYGKITLKQFKLLRSEYQLVMWDVLTYDFDKKLPAADCLRLAIKNTRCGSVVVFHDSLKAWPNLHFVLPRYLAHFSALGYRFEAL